MPSSPTRSGPWSCAVSGAVLGQQDLASIGEALEDLADALFDGIAPPRDTRWIDILHALWCETWKPALTLGDYTRLREQELIALDGEQLQLLDYIDSKVQQLMQVVSQPERVKKCLVLEKPFGLADDELTATLKVRRRHIIAKYEDRLEAFYNQ